MFLKFQFMIYFIITTLLNFNINAAPLDACLHTNCVAVIDAGSTGTRIHVYATNKNNPTATVREVWFNSIKPGMAAVEPSKVAINQYIRSLLTEIPEREIPLYFYATAGMRLIPDATQTKYYKTLREWFKENNKWELIEARTITGKEEGVFGWLSVNHQLGLLDHPQSQTVGVMDMGGASVQVSFQVENTASIDEDDIAILDFNGQKIKLFVHSFLGLGKKVFAYQFMNVKDCYTDGYHLPNGLVGQGSAEICQLYVTKLINLVHDVNEIIQPALTQNPQKHWYAMGGVYHFLKDPMFKRFNKSYESEQLLNFVSNNICHRKWPSLAQDYPNSPSLHNYCLFASYYYALMVNGYGISSEETIHFLSKDKTPGWTLGVVLHLS